VQESQVLALEPRPARDRVGERSSRPWWSRTRRWPATERWVMARGGAPPHRPLSEPPAPVGDLSLLCIRSGGTNLAPSLSTHPPSPPPSSGQHSHLRAHRPPGSRRCQGAGGGGYFRWDVREGRRSPWAWEVICHPKWRRIQRGQLCWRATPAKVVNMCHFRNIEGKYIFDTAKVIIKEWSSVIMLKS
jgi:hypothetical protein